MPEPLSSLPPPLRDQHQINSPELVRDCSWMPIFEDCEHGVLMMNLQTGAVREAPWISLRTHHGLTFFANLTTRETRWFPPYTWMDGWVERAQSIRDGRGPTAVSNSMLPARSPLLRNVLEPRASRLRVDGGAPYLCTHGVPQYLADELDTARTHPTPWMQQSCSKPGEYILDHANIALLVPDTALGPHRGRASRFLTPDGRTVTFRHFDHDTGAPSGYYVTSGPDRRPLPRVYIGG